MYELILIIGRVGRAPELQMTPHGVPVSSFSVAVNHRYTDAACQLVERVKWSRITTCRKLAETCAQYIKKGQCILVEGEVDASTWVDNKDGSAHAASSSPPPLGGS
jgi:single-strand DNA-binding protein